MADIGLDCSGARALWVTAADVAAWLPPRALDDHKWRSACWVVAGSPGMTGAGHLAVRAAQRTGAGYVRVSSPGVADDPGRPTEAVGVPLPAEGWDGDVLAGADRFGSLVLGPGLGRNPDDLAAVRQVMAGARLPVLVDGDGLAALAPGTGGEAGPGGERPTPLRERPARLGAVRLAGAPGPHPPRRRVPHADRPPAGARSPRRGPLAGRPPGGVVLLKGPATVVAEPGGRVLLVGEGDARLATAGSGDVLSGVIGALLARGLPTGRGGRPRGRGSTGGRPVRARPGAWWPAICPTWWPSCSAT